MFNDFWVPKWPVVDFTEIRTYPAKARAGLQLADCVASAFYQGLELNNAGIVKPQCAKILRGRMCTSSRGRIYDFGVKVWPAHARMLVRPEQRELLDFYRSP